MELELLEKQLEHAGDSEIEQIAKELLQHKRTMSDEIAELQALGGHILNLCNGLSETRERIDIILRKIK